MAVVSNTSPICYLLLIDCIDLLPQLFGRVIIPEAVADELAAPKSPAILQNWIAQPPDWLEIQGAIAIADAAVAELDPGEREAILLAESIEADLIVLDDMAARRIAAKRGFVVTGTLGVLEQSARLGSIDFAAAVERLQQTTFWASSSLIQSLLERHRRNSR